MRKKIRLLQKFFSIFTSFNLVLQSLFGVLLVNPGFAFAQQETPAEVSEEVIQPTTEPRQETTIQEPTTITIVEEQQAEPTTDPLIEPTTSLIMTEEPTTTPETTDFTPTPTQEEVQEANISAPPPDETGPPTEIQVTPVASPEPAKAGELSANILENTSAESVVENNPETQSNACLITDKDDYAPTDTVVITGTNFSPNKEYLLKITSDNEPKVNHEEKITTDNEGSFVYAYQLDGNYRPNYKVEVKDISGIVLSIIEFTDTPLVVINEFASNTGGSSEWVELYNLGATPVDPDGWTIYFDDNLSTTQKVVLTSSNLIPAAGYITIDALGNWLLNSGDKIILRDSSTEIDSVTYGGGSGSDISAPGNGESAGLCPDGTGAWTILGTLTKGTENDCSSSPGGGGSGAIWTTDGTCGDSGQDLNHFPKGHFVYINGSNFAANTEYPWNVKGKPGGASCDSNLVVASGVYQTDSNGDFCFNAYQIADNDCGEYGVNFGSKKDNYGVDGAALPTSTPTPTLTSTTTPTPTLTPTPTPVDPYCPNDGVPNDSASPLDTVDLGDSTSESEHNASGWGTDPGSGNYGGRDGGQTFSLVVGQSECNDNGRSASFTLDAGSNYANKIKIRHLDGVSNLDSFDVFVNGNLLTHYLDQQDSSEIWYTTEYPLNNLTGEIDVTLTLTDLIWGGCSTWGQLAINWVEIGGYECDPQTSVVSVCKKDVAGNPLPGWKVYLKGEEVDLVNVYPSNNGESTGGSSNQVVNSSSLDLGDYLLEAIGYYTYRPGAAGAEYTDAVYSLRLPGDMASGVSIYTGAYVPWVNVTTFPSPYIGWLGVRVNGVSTNWSDYFASDHKYVLGYPGYNDGSFSFTILDDGYSDNSGKIPVGIYKGYTGITGETGCVTFGNVPFGSYYLDEVLKSGWEKVSGTGKITVEQEEQTLELVNREIVPEISCGDGILNGDEECDGVDGVTEGQFCTFSCKLINIYDGGHACPRETTPVLLDNYEGVVIGSQESDGVTLSLTSGKTYLFEAWGTYGYGGGPVDNVNNRADAGYATGDNWSSRRDDLLGIPSSAKYRGITSLLSDMGTGVFGLIDWGEYNADHLYQKVYTPTSDNVKFLISDWYDTWYSGDLNSDTNKDQYGMWDNEGSLSLNVYECKTLGSIFGYKFNDLDGSGQQDGGEPNVSYETISGGVVIFIDENYNESLDEGEENTNTNNDGYYEFTGLEAGTYDICEVLPSGWINTYPSSSLCHSVTLGAGEDVSYDFGNKKRTGILACKYEDLNGDGILDDGEPPIEGVTMTLEKRGLVCNFDFLCPFGDQSASFFPFFPFPIPGLCLPFCHYEWQQDSSGQTGEDGCYLFDDLRNGNYRVSETVPEGFANTTPVTQGPVTIDNENTNYILNFLNTRAQGSIGDFVWKDVNDDNVQDPGEPGIGGVLVKVCLDDGDGIWDPAVDTECKTESTDLDGKYLVSGLLAGVYFAFADKTTLPGGGVNYDLSVGGVNPHKVNLGEGENFLAADFGFAPPVAIKLTKTNDKPNASTGETVTYTLTIKTDERDLSSMVLTDILPFGFIYQQGTATVTGGTVVSVEPTVSLLGKRLRWTWTAVPAYSTVVVTYQIKIDSGNKPACYTNFAFVWGTGSPTVVESAVVDSKVIIGADLSYNVEVGGEVLGASTGEVLGASLPAAGSNTWYLVLAFGLISSGLLLKLGKRTLKK